MLTFARSTAGRPVSVVALTLALILAWAPPADAQEEEDDSAPQGVSVEEGLEQVDEMIGGEDEVFAGTGEIYDPAGRRDPFRSLLAARQRPIEVGPRPPGIPGLLIDQMELTGIFITSTGPVAQVQSAEEDRSYLLRIGDQLFDGDVVSISRDEVAFKQIVDDPAALKPFRDVVKTLKPESEDE